MRKLLTAATFVVSLWTSQHGPLSLAVAYDDCPPAVCDWDDMPMNCEGDLVSEWDQDCSETEDDHA